MLGPGPFTSACTTIGRVQNLRNLSKVPVSSKKFAFVPLVVRKSLTI
jgi:hypothetical protein